MRSDFFLIAAGRVLVAILLVISLRVMTHLLPISQYGVFALLTVFQSFAGLILINPTGQYLNRHTHEWIDQGCLLANVRALERYWAAASIGTGIVATIWIYIYTLDGAALTAIAGGFGIGLLINGTTSLGVATSRMNMMGLRRPSVIWQVAGSVLSLGFSWLLTAWSPNAISWILGQSLGLSLAAIGAKSALRKTTNKLTQSAEARLMDVLSWAVIRRYCFPLALMAFFMWVDGNAYRFFLEPAWGLERLGLFVIALSIPGQMTMVMESIVQQYVYPYAFRGLANASSDEGLARVVSDIVSLLTPIYLMWGAFLLLSCSAFLYLLTDPKYHDASNFLIIGIITEALRLLSAPWMFVAQARKKFLSVIYPYALSAGLIISAAILSWNGNRDELFLGACLVTAAIIKAILLIRKMHLDMPAKLTLRPIILASSLLTVALLLNRTVISTLEQDWVSACITIAASTLGIGFFLLAYLRNSDSFIRLKQHSLSQNA